MIEADIKVDTREFQAAADLAVQYTSRTVPQFINGQLLRVASWAIKLTKKGNPDEIALTLGQVASRFSVSKKTGKRRIQRVYSQEENTFAARLINAGRKKKGQPPLFGKALVDAVRKLISRRVRSVAFIVAGWIPGIKTLSKAVGYSEELSVRKRGQDKGAARPATFSLSNEIKGSIENTALLTENRYGSHGNPMPIAQPALQQAMSLTAKDMMEHLHKKLQPEMNTLNAKL